MANTTGCLQTVIKNVSGGELLVAAWPPRGKTFAEDEEVTINGNLWAYFASWHRNVRVLDALYSLFTSGKLAIVSEPNPILYDATQDRSAMIVLDDNGLSADDPCFADTEFSSSL